MFSLKRRVLVIRSHPGEAELKFSEKPGLLSNDPTYFPGFQGLCWAVALTNPFL